MNETKAGRCPHVINWVLFIYLFIFETEGQYINAKAQEAIDHLTSFSIK